MSGPENYRDECSRRSNNCVRVYTHEHAVVGTFQLHIENYIYGELKNVVLEQLSLLRDWVIDNNGFIGHIKGYLETPQKIFNFSTTGTEITVMENAHSAELSAAGVHIACIVFGISENVLECRVTDFIRKLK